MSYLIHFNPNHDPKTGKFTFGKNNRIRSKTKNYMKVINSLSDEEYRLFNKVYVVNNIEIDKVVNDIIS